VPDHIPGRVEPIAWVYCEERVFATYIVRSFSDSANPAICQRAQTAVRRQAIDAGAVPKVALPAGPGISRSW